VFAKVLFCTLLVVLMRRDGARKRNYEGLYGLGSDRGAGAPSVPLLELSLTYALGSGGTADLGGVGGTTHAYVT
jgi:hypothetical protein